MWMSETRSHYWRTHRSAEQKALLDPVMISQGQTFPCAVERYVMRKLNLRPERLWGAHFDATRGATPIRFEIRSRQAGNKRDLDLDVNKFDRLIVCDWLIRSDRKERPYLYIEGRVLESKQIALAGTKKVNALLNEQPMRLRGWVKLPRAS